MKFRCCRRGWGKSERGDLLENKFVNLKACKLIIDEKLNLRNYLHDAMDFHAVRQLIVKSRHKILMPTLVLHLTKTKLNRGEYRSSFSRNLYERTDRPVFTIEEAVGQLKTNDPKRSDIEKAMDEFFMTHLPEEVVQAAGDYENNELDEDAIRFQKKSEVPAKKNRTQTQLGNCPQAINRNQSLPIDEPNKKRKKKKQKSDFTLAFVDTSEQVAKLAYQSEVGQHIQKMRTVAKTQHPESLPSSPFPQSQSQRVNAEMQSPRPKILRPRRTSITLTPTAFKKRYSKHISTNLVMMKQIESIVAEKQAQDKPSIDNQSPSLVKRKVSIVKENALDFSDKEESKSIESEDSDPIEELDINADRESPNTQAYQTAVNRSRL